MRNTLANICAKLGVTLIGQDREFDGVCTDSRLLKPGQLFVALNGPNFKGQDFVKQDLLNVAAAACVSEAIPGLTPLIICSDTLDFYKKLANWYLSQMNVPVLAITGSCGKTTIKNMLDHVMQSLGQITLATKANNNNAIGVAQTVLALEPKHRQLILEMGARHPHDIEELCQIARPHAAVVSNVHPAHLASFGSIGAIKAAKAKILAKLGSSDTACINLNEPNADYFKQIAGPAKILSYGIDCPLADLQASNLRCLARESELQLTYQDQQLDISWPWPGQHMLENGLAATALALSQGFKLAEIARALSQFVPKDQRQVFKLGLNGALIIEDCYNANPAACHAAIKVLAEQKQGLKILVQGDMGELGSLAIAAHQALGESAKKAGISHLFGYGPLAGISANAFGAQGLAFRHQDELLAKLKPMLNQDVCVLIKGSRFMQMEIISQALTQNLK